MKSENRSAFIDNAKDSERCFPSDAYLAELTHLNPDTVRAKRQLLRKKKLIHWVHRYKGNEQTSNRYYFDFGHTDLKREGGIIEEEDINIAVDKSVDNSVVTVVTTQAESPTPTRPQPYPHPSTTPPPPAENPTNTKGNPNIQYKCNTGSIVTNAQVANPTFAASIDNAYFSISDEINGTTNSVSGRDSKKIDELVEAAMILGEVKDDYNRNSFRKHIASKDLKDALDFLKDFAEKKRCGEFRAFKNMAQKLMTELKKVPDVCVCTTAKGGYKI